MTVTGSKIHKTAFRNDIYFVSILKSVTHDILAGILNLNGHLTKPCHIHLAVEVTGVAADGTILHLEEMLFHDDSVATCNCHENISKLSSLIHLHHLESVHHSLQSLDRIHLSNDDLGTKTLGSHRNTLSAPAITCHDNILSCDDQIGGPVYSVPYRLTCTVTVIEKVLAVCIVDKHHRELEFSGLVELDKSEDTCCCLLATSDDIRNEVCVLCVHKVHKVTAVIDDDVRTDLENATDMRLILLRSCVVPRIYIEACLHESCCYIILS